MRKVNIGEFRKEVLAMVDANRDKITSLESKSDNSIFTFCGKNYACEITLQNDWIGYDLGIETPKGSLDCGLEEDTDLYPIHGGVYEKVALEIYDDLLAVVNAIFDGQIYYKSDDKEYYVARPKEDKYLITHMTRKRFLFWDFLSGQREAIYNPEEFKKLGLTRLS